MLNYSYSYHRDHLNIIKIAIINSYTQDHPCTAPQVDGFKRFLRQFYKSYRFKIIAYDMKTKTENITKTQIYNISNIILKKIEKYKPDFIFTTDDNACKYLGIKLSTKYKVFSSGLNMFPVDYIKKYKLTDKNKIIFVAEYIKLDKLWYLFDKVGYYPLDFYIITEPPNTMSITNYYMFKNLSEELKKKNYNFHVRTVGNVYDLKDLLLTLNNIGRQSIIIPVIQRLRDINGKFINKLYITNYIYKYNEKHLDIGCNEIFCRYGLSICIGPSFYDMGSLAAAEIYKFIKNKYESESYSIKNHSIIIPKMNLVLNKYKLEKLKLNMIMDFNDNVYFKNNIEYDLVNKFYDEVEKK